MSAAVLAVACLQARVDFEKVFAAQGWAIGDVAGRESWCLVFDPGFTCSSGEHSAHPVTSDALLELRRRVDQMLGRGVGTGRVVVTSSRDVLGVPGNELRAAVAGGLIAMARSLALEHARDGVTVNVVCALSSSPGPRSSTVPTAANGFTPRELLPDPVTVTDVAEAAAFFASADAGYVTGQTLHVCGGASLVSSGSV